jgi:hypothetical protein
MRWNYARSTGVKTDQSHVITAERPSGQVIRVAYSRPSEVELAVASFKRSGYRILEIAPKNGVVVRPVKVPDEDKEKGPPGVGAGRPFRG